MSISEVIAMSTKPEYRRIVLKLSGEALAPENANDGILDFSKIEKVASVIKKCKEMGVQIAVIVGAGNIWRGRVGGGMNHSRADQMGMLATTINALAIQDTFIKCGIDTVVMTSVEMHAYADYYTARHADQALNEGKVVVFGCGLGWPYFSTDTPAVVRAAEIEADVVLMAKNVDYLYTADPKKDPDAKPIYDITYAEILDKGLKAFDMTAVSFCKENNITTYGFALSDPENIYRVVMGEAIGTKMHN